MPDENTMELFLHDLTPEAQAKWLTLMDVELNDINEAMPIAVFVNDNPIYASNLEEAEVS
jgi:hypothetical protein